MNFLENLVAKWRFVILKWHFGVVKWHFSLLKLCANEKPLCAAWHTEVIEEESVVCLSLHLHADDLQVFVST